MKKKTFLDTWKIGVIVLVIILIAACILGSIELNQEQYSNSHTEGIGAATGSVCFLFAGIILLVLFVKMGLFKKRKGFW
jgi:uncharacterized membrane protein